MAFKSRIKEKKIAEDLKNFYSDNEKELKDLLYYLNHLDTGWRRHSTSFFKTLKELERELERKNDLEKT